MNKKKLEEQLSEWQEIYDREMKTVFEEGATTIFNAGEAMSPHLKAANLAYNNVIKIQKLLGEDVEETSALDKFLANAKNRVNTLTDGAKGKTRQKKTAKQKA